MTLIKLVLLTDKASTVAQHTKQTGDSKPVMKHGCKLSLLPPSLLPLPTVVGVQPPEYLQQLFMSNANFPAESLSVCIQCESQAEDMLLAFKTTPSSKVL